MYCRLRVYAYALNKKNGVYLDESHDEPYEHVYDENPNKEQHECHENI